jgi:hypothetical protein
MVRSLYNKFKRCERKPRLNVRHYPAFAREDWGKPQKKKPVRLVGIAAEIRPGHLPNTSQQPYRLTNLLTHEY